MIEYNLLRGQDDRLIGKVTCDDANRVVRIDFFAPLEITFRGGIWLEQDTSRGSSNFGLINYYKLITPP